MSKPTEKVTSETCENLGVGKREGIMLTALQNHA